jgi:hypothetical protein
MMAAPLVIPAVEELAVLAAAAIVAVSPIMKNAAEGIAKGLSAMADGIKEKLSKSEPKAAESCPEDADEQDDANDTPPAEETESKEIARQKQDGHVKDTPANKNRLKQGKPTSVFDGGPEEADELTQEAWKKGTPVEGRPNVRDYDFGRRVGTNPNGEPATRVRVHEDSAGRIHGHPR